jgi:hypothetical protein
LHVEPPPGQTSSLIMWTLGIAEDLVIAPLESDTVVTDWSATVPDATPAQ